MVCSRSEPGAAMIEDMVTTVGPMVMTVASVSKNVTLESSSKQHIFWNENGLVVAILAGWSRWLGLAGGLESVAGPGLGCAELGFADLGLARCFSGWLSCWLSGWLAGRQAKASLPTYRLKSLVMDEYMIVVAPKR